MTNFQLSAIHNLSQYLECSGGTLLKHSFSTGERELPGQYDVVILCCVLH